MPVLSKEQLTQIENLRAAGHSYRYIAKQVGCNVNTVNKHCKDPNFGVPVTQLRETFKRRGAVESLNAQEGAFKLASKAVQKGDPHGFKAATGAAKDLDQINAVATGDDRQAGVALAPPTSIDLKILIQQILGNPSPGA